MKIAINSRTSGKFTRKMLNNREHLVTEMVPIVGNSIMNRGFYPLDQIQNSFDQLNFLPAPNGHPKINNQVVSAFHPLAVNAFNIGGMVRNPKMDGLKVINEFWLDIDIANKSDDGKELIRRIENGEEVGVSTGINLKQTFVKNQEDYDWIASELDFDHVAILLNEKAAGDAYGTKLVLNQDNLQIVNCAESRANLEQSDADLGNTSVANHVKKAKRMITRGEMVHNSLTVDSLKDQARDQARLKWPESNYYLWCMALFPTEYRIVFEVETKDETSSKLYSFNYSVDSNDKVSLIGDPVEVVKKVEFVPVSGDANVNNNNPEEDNPMDKTHKEKETKEVVTNNDDTEVSVEQAIKTLEAKGFVVNSASQAKDFEFFVNNKDSIESVINREKQREEDLRKKLVENSELTEDDVKGMSFDMLNRLSDTLVPKQNYGMGPGSSTQVVNTQDDSEVFEEDYTSYSEDKE